jgi:hypothetical protein
MAQLNGRLAQIDRLLRVDYGPSFISIADVRRNVRQSRKHRSSFGQNQPASRAAPKN